MIVVGMLNLVIAAAGLGLAVMVLSKTKGLQGNVEGLEASINRVNDKLKGARGKLHRRLYVIEYDLHKRLGNLKVEVPFTIIEDCIACGSCKAACPIEGCISEGDMYTINMTLCEACGKCCEVCPTTSCIPVAGTLDEFLAKREAEAA